MARKSEIRNEKAAREWLEEACDGEIEVLGLRGLEDVLVSAYGPDEWELGARCQARASIRRVLKAAARLGRQPEAAPRSGR